MFFKIYFWRGLAGKYVPSIEPLQLLFAITKGIEFKKKGISYHLNINIPGDTWS